MKARRRAAAKDAPPIPAAHSPRLHVTDHALFRWLERAGVVDVEQLRMALTVALDRAYQAAARMQQSEVLILSGGLVFVVRDGAVVTVLQEDGRHDQARAMTRAPMGMLVGDESHGG